MSRVSWSCLHAVFWARATRMLGYIKRQLLLLSNSFRVFKLCMQSVTTLTAIRSPDLVTAASSALCRLDATASALSRGPGPLPSPLRSLAVRVTVTASLAA